MGNSVLREEASEEGQCVPTHGQCSTLSNSDMQHGTVDATPQESRMAICLMGTGVLYLQGQCTGDLFHNTLSYKLEGEDREGREKSP